MDVRRDVGTAARYGTCAEFLAVYQPPAAASWAGRGRSLLHEALCNKDSVERTSIARRLLDDGADAAAVTPDGWSTAQLLTGRVPVDRRADLDVPLLTALFDAGCDVNHVHPTRGTALVQLAALFMMSDDELAPYYEAFLARPDLDLTSVRGRRSDLATIRRWRTHRGRLVELLEEHVRSRGMELPSDTVFTLAPWADAARILAAYEPGDADRVEPGSGWTLLHLVLDNPDVDARLRVAHRLLDDGADPALATPEGLTPAHILLRRHGERDFVREAALLRRLLDAGADVNAVAGNGVGTPLNCLAGMSNYEETSRMPVYDVLLAHPGLDPLTKVGRSRTAWDLIAKTRTGVLRARLQQRFGLEG
jgi:hypothetical protein